MTGSLTRRLVAVLALLLLAWGLFVAMLASRVAHEQGQETLQRLSHGLATHIVEHWPVLGAGGEDDPRARSELLRMLMTVNPGIQVYLLDATGRVETYIGEPGMVREHQVDMDPVGRFLAGAALPLYGTDPMRPGAKRVFSVSRFPSRAGEAQSSAYLYIVLDGEARNLVASQLSQERIWKGVAWAAVAGMAMLLIVGALAVRRLTRPLQRLAAEMSAFELQGGAALAVRNRWDGRDEVEALGQSFQGMARRIAEQHEMQQKQSTAHREVIANVAHDLRTPLTALHGHLEALRAGFQDSGNTVRHLDTAIAQSDKLRRLIQQLFELATLQSMEQPVQGERFRFDEVVADAVQKFEVLAGPRRVALTGAAPGAVEVEGDLHLIERALTNLIDNAVRHTPEDNPVRVHLSCDEHEVAVMIEDRGPGLPKELAHRLEAGASVRDPALRRSSGGGMGGLGLAIAQRIATLHGGRLQALPSDQGGTRMRLTFPRRAVAEQAALARAIAGKAN